MMLAGIPPSRSSPPPPSLPAPPRLCGFCQLPGRPDCPTDPLIGPLGEGAGTLAALRWCHSLCALWSPGVFEDESGGLHDALKEMRRGAAFKCAGCGKRGASLGCAVEKCRRCYHFHCAQAAQGLLMVEGLYGIWCPVHAKGIKEAMAKGRKAAGRAKLQVGMGMGMGMGMGVKGGAWRSIDAGRAGLG